MFKNSSFFNTEEALEQGQAVFKQQTSTTVKNMTSQVTGKQQTPAAATGQPSPAVHDKMTQDFISDLYAPSDPLKQTAQVSQSTPQQQGAKQSAQSDDQAKLSEARQKLEAHKKQHMETYYVPTFEQRQKQEERAQEKVEREDAEDKQKRWELEQKKNETPIALKMATNKAEMFRGAAG